MYYYIQLFLSLFNSDRYKFFSRRFDKYRVRLIIRLLEYKPAFRLIVL